MMQASLYDAEGAINQAASQEDATAESIYKAANGEIERITAGMDEKQAAALTSRLSAYAQSKASPIVTARQERARKVAKEAAGASFNENKELMAEAFVNGDAETGNALLMGAMTSDPVANERRLGEAVSATSDRLFTMLAAEMGSIQFMQAYEDGKLNALSVTIAEQDYPMRMSLAEAERIRKAQEDKEKEQRQRQKNAAQRFDEAMIDPYSNSDDLRAVMEASGMEAAQADALMREWQGVVQSADPATAIDKAEAYGRSALDAEADTERRRQELIARIYGSL